MKQKRDAIQKRDARLALSQTEWAEIEYGRRMKAGGMRPEDFEQGRAQYWTLASQGVSVMQVNEMAYGVAPNDAGNHFEDYQREPLANYIVTSPYLASLRWRDFRVQQMIKSLVREYLRIETSPQNLASEVMEMPMREIRPLVVRLAAGCLPELRKFNFSPEDLARTRVVACDEHAISPTKMLNMAFRYDMVQELFPSGDPEKGLVKYTNGPVGELLEVYHGKADLVNICGMLDARKNFEEKQKLVRQALYFLHPEGKLICDFPLRTKETRKRQHARRLAINRPLRLREAKNLVMQICANIGATVECVVSPRGEAPALLMCIIRPVKDNLDYRIGAGLEDDLA